MSSHPNPAASKQKGLLRCPHQLLDQVQDDGFSVDSLLLQSGSLPKGPTRGPAIWAPGPQYPSVSGVSKLWDFSLWYSTGFQRFQTRGPHILRACGLWILDSWSQPRYFLVHSGGSRFLKTGCGSATWGCLVDISDSGQSLHFPVLRPQFLCPCKRGFETQGKRAVVHNPQSLGRPDVLCYMLAASYELVVKVAAAIERKRKSD